MKVKEIIPINDINTLMNMLETWHKKKIAVLEHILTVPIGTEMRVEINNETQSVILNSEVHAAFIAGVSIGLMEFVSLPFVIEREHNTDLSVNDKIQ